MRILMVVLEFPALSETFVLDQITGLIDRGHDVSVLALRPRNENVTHAEVDRYALKERVYYAFNGSKIAVARLLIQKLLTSFNKQSRNLVIDTLHMALRRVFGKDRFLLGPALFFVYGARLCDVPYPDVAVCHFGPNGDLIAKLKSTFSFTFPIATIFHGVDISAHIRSDGLDIYDFLFKKGDLFLPVSDFFQRRLLELGCPSDKIFVQRMGIDPKNFPQHVQHATKEFVFLSVGRFVEKKGQLDAIRAFAICHNKHPLVGMSFVIIGDGQLRSEIEQLIDDLGLNKLVHLPGALSRKEILQFLSDCNAFVLPSVTGADGDMEGFPVSILEAMAMELPILSTFHSGIPEIVEDGVNGFLVEEHDVDTLADRMEILIENPDLCLRMGKEGRSKVLNVLNLDNWNTVLATRLERLVSKVDIV